ncbi:MAG TPA: alpha/beta hydrolase [Candidatus Dormibacteraeota bacterium]|nr:alpha/beta hydrolase [Candidatus Dormibacteraeota bacterium]
MPEGEAPHPVAVLVHGGFWRMPWGADLMHALAGDLHRRGWATWNLEYRRLGAPGGGWPGTFEDAAAGMDAIAAVDAGLDLGRVVAVGHSAGGQLSLWLATRSGLPAGAPGAGPAVVPSAVVALAAVSDLAASSRLGLDGDAAAELVGGPPDRVPERYAVASPRERLPLGVPVLLVHGDADDRVPVAMSREYAGAARAAGDDVDLEVVPGSGHPELIDPRSGAWEVVRRWLGGPHIPVAM